MGWIVEGAAVEVHAQGQVAALEATSTSTVALGPADLGGAAARLRLYGVDDQAVARALPAAGARRPASPCGLKDRAIAYLDSQLSAPFRFLVDKAGAIAATCVPAGRAGVTWPVRATSASAPRNPAMNVTYKDVTVLRLPDASWLMVLARYRTLATEAPAPMPGKSVADVVAWRAADPAFTRSLTGPYWLVDGRRALPDETRPTWLGVPSAVVAGQGSDLRVDLYYTFHVDDHNGGRSYLEAALGEGGPSTVGAGGRPGSAQVAKQGVGVKRFRWADLQGQLTKASVPEERWEATGTVPGELLGRVRVWAASDLPGSARRFDEAFTGVRIVDPAPFACAGAADLFFAAIPERGPDATRGPQDAYGIWHATALPKGGMVCAQQGAVGPCALTQAVEGLDFLVAAGGVSSRDRLAVTSPSALFLDPDPVRLPNGGVRVAAGNVEKGGALTAVAGGATDVCRPWGEAWQR